MKNLTLFVSFALLSGCGANRVLLEKTARKIVAQQVDDYLEKGKAKFFLNECKELDQRYDEMREALRKEIEKQ